MKNILLVGLVLLIISCGKEYDKATLNSFDRLWAPYSVGDIMTYQSEDGVKLEAKVIEVVSTEYLHTNVIDLGKIGMLDWLA